jgi:membrane protease YdiL (CAAX protease family)
MNPQDLSPTQQLITLMASLLGLGLVFGSMMVHAWVLVAWKRVMNWSGWLHDRVHDRIGLIDLLGCVVCIAIAQIAVAGLFREELKIDVPGQSVPSPAPSVVAEPAVIAPAVIAPAGFSHFLSSQESLESDSPDPDGADSVGSDARPAQSDLQSPWFMVAATFSLVAGSLASALWTLVRTASTPRLLGMASGKVPRDVMVGVLVFLWITPLVLVVNVAISQWTEVQYEHPVIDSLRGRSWAFPLLFVSAVIFAPLWEEYAFRFLLVNWLDTIRTHGLDFKAMVFGRPKAEVGLTVESELDLEGNVAESHSQRLESYPPWWIAIVSGLLFGLAHFEYGVSWVPLVVLGTVLARVYQLQRSILPCFLIHALFNSLAMVGFAFELFVKGA